MKIGGGTSVGIGVAGAKVDVAFIVEVGVGGMGGGYGMGYGPGYCGD